MQTNWRERIEFVRWIASSKNEFRPPSHPCEKLGYRNFLLLSLLMFFVCRAERTLCCCWLLLFIFISKLNANHHLLLHDWNRLKLEPILILEGDYLPTSVRPYVCMYVQYVRMYNMYVCMYVCTISNRCTICTYVQYLIDVQYVRMYNMYVCMYVKYLIDEL